MTVETDLLSAAKAAKALDISTRALRDHVRDGSIAYIVTGRGKKRPGIRFAREDIDQFLRERRKPDPRPTAQIIKLREHLPQLVYFIRAGNAVKIGRAIDVRSRLRTLQVAHAEKLELLFTLRGGVAMEGKLHSRFARYALIGEWFRLEGALRAYVDKRLLATARAPL